MYFSSQAIFENIYNRSIQRVVGIDGNQLLRS